MDWIRITGDIALLVFLVITMFKISRLEKRLDKLEKTPPPKPKRGFCCGIDEIKEPRYYTKDQK